jgi:hypothetical protein
MRLCVCMLAWGNGQGVSLGIASVCQASWSIGYGLVLLGVFHAPLIPIKNAVMSSNLSVSERSGKSHTASHYVHELTGVRAFIRMFLHSRTHQRGPYHAKSCDRGRQHGQRARDPTPGCVVGLESHAQGVCHPISLRWSGVVSSSIQNWERQSKPRSWQKQL